MNKVDRPAARPDWVIDQTFELFCDLGATDEQCGALVLHCMGGLGACVLRALSVLQPGCHRREVRCVIV